MRPGQGGADPYVPGHGDLSYEVMHYELTLAYAVRSNLLEGTAVIRARAVGDLSSIRLDLFGLRPAKVAVAVGSGRTSVTVRRFKTTRGVLTITLADPIAAGSDVEVTVKYGGNPTVMPEPWLDAAGWEELEDGVIVAAQPHGAPTWFPCNDRPSSKATYGLTITLPAEYHVEFSGEPVSVRRKGASRTWVFRQDEPMASYLATVQIGQYRVTKQRGPVPMRVVAPPDLGGPGFEASFGRQPEMMATFIEAFGPYPFPGYTTVITDDALDIPLESQALSTFGRNFASTDWDSVRLVAHELAHQWFGNAVTLRHWKDIWLHEGFACYAEWVWSQASGGASAQHWAEHHYARLRMHGTTGILSDPTPRAMFDDWVYKRGALTLHAVRLRVGDTAFFAILRSWVATHRGGSVTTQQFVEHASTQAGVDLGPLFDAWVNRPELPPAPVPAG